MIDKSLIYNKSVDTDEDSTWIQLLRGASDDRPDSPNNAVRDEVARYLKEKLVSQRLDPLIYWKRNHKGYPNLSKLVRVYLCPPSSSVATCERAGIQSCQKCCWRAKTGYETRES